MYKKWIYLFVVFVFILVTGCRIYQLNVNAFTFKDTIHSPKETFEIKGYKITVNKVYELTEKVIKKKKKATYSLYMEPNDSIVAVDLTVENVGSLNKKPEEKLILGQFQLKKDAFVKYANNSMIQKNSDTDFTLNFIVPKEIIHAQSSYYLAVPFGMWQKDKRDLVKFPF